MPVELIGTTERTWHKRYRWRERQSSYTVKRGTKKNKLNTSASFALLFVQNYAMLDLSDKITSGGGYGGFQNVAFLLLKSDNAQSTILLYTGVVTCSRI
jgi:hypothetical protein